MLNIALMGAGRIGKMHAKNIALHPICNLSYVFDINQEFASQIAQSTKAKVTKSPDEAINNNDVDVVFIASATPTHVDFIIKGAKAGKAIFCEKPIDLNSLNQRCRIQHRGVQRFLVLYICEVCLCLVSLYEVLCRLRHLIVQLSFFLKSH